jgi:hypothetical protein
MLEGIDVSYKPVDSVFSFDLIRLKVGLYYIIRVKCNVTWYNFFVPEDTGSEFLRNCDIHLQHYTTSKPTMLQS